MYRTRREVDQVACYASTLACFSPAVATTILAAPSIPPMNTASAPRQCQEAGHSSHGLTAGGGVERRR